MGFIKRKQTTPEFDMERARFIYRNLKRWNGRSKMSVFCLATEWAINYLNNAEEMRCDKCKNICVEVCEHGRCAECKCDRYCWDVT